MLSLLINNIFYYGRNWIEHEAFYIEKSEDMDFDFFWDVAILQKIVPAKGSSKLTQSFDLSVLHLKPFVEHEAVIKIRYSNRKWVL